MGLFLSEQQNPAVGYGHRAAGRTSPWEHPICAGLSLVALRLSWVVELGGRDAQHPAWRGLWYSLKGDVGLAPKAMCFGLSRD